LYLSQVSTLLKRPHSLSSLFFNQLALNGVGVFY